MNIAAKLPARYKLLTQSLQSGGFGSVVPIEDSYLRRVVLLKVMHDIANNTQLENEIHCLCAARSRHVVEIYDVIQDASGISGVIIERLRGRDFLEFWKEAPSSPEKYLKVLYQIATALRDLHAAGVVHRDLKLDNFKESSAGVLKLFDFGISSPDNGYQTKQNKGTLVYAAPELYKSGATITPEMDIYAFGVCAWYLASNKLPKALLEQPPQTSIHLPSIVFAMPSGLHQDVIHIIDACLDPNPTGRPKAAALSALFAHHLLRNRHRGLFVQGKSKVFELSVVNPTVNIKIGTLGELSVDYDGLAFKVSAVGGAVRINNHPASVGDSLHDACLLSFGDRMLGSAQEWVTFFSSHPEVVL